MFTFRIYCGLNTNGADVNAREIALNLAAIHFANGHTVYDATGRWNGEVGVIDERTIVLEVITDGLADGDIAVAKFATEYRTAANQESVMITKRKESCFFV